MIEASGNMGDASILERSVWLSCLTSFENEEQGKMVLRTIQRIESMRNRPGAQPDLKHSPDLRARYMAVGLFRTGDFKGALEQCELSEKFMDAELRSKLATGDGPAAWADFYKALTLLQLGRKGEARNLYFQLVKKKRTPPSKEHPLAGTKNADGSALVFWIAYEEAKKVFEPPSSR